MEIKTKAQIICDFVSENSDEPLAKDFFEYNDLGIPLALSVVSNLCILTDDGKQILNETYDNVCNEMEVPNDIEYEDIGDMHDQWRKNNTEE